MNDGAAAQSRSGGAPPSRSRTGAADEAQAEQGMADGVAAADVLLTELATERRAHARAERELKDKLAAAREAGSVVLASLRDQTVAAAEARRGRGWLAPMLRRIGSRTAGQLQRFGGKPSVITLADRAQSTGQWQRAARLSRTALDRNPLNPPIWVQYGHALKETGKLAQDEAAYRRAISEEPTVADTHLQLGHALKRQGRIEEAHAAYLRCCALDPSSPDALHELEGLGWSQAQAAELRDMLGSDGVQLSGREVAERLRYERWVAQYDTLHDADRAAIRAHITELVKRPLISVVVPVYNTEEQYLREMIESVLRQLYPHWELCLADDASTKPHIQQVLREFSTLDSRIKFVRRETNGHIAATTNTALELAVGEFVALLDHDDLLSETALYEIAVEVDAHPDADVIYSDSDSIDDAGRRSEPYFKTDWNPELMLGYNIVNHLGVYRRALVEEVGCLGVGFEGGQDYDLMLRVAEASAPSRIRHIPAVLYHWRRNASSPSFSEASMERCVVAARGAVRQHLERTGVQAHIEPVPGAPIWTRVIYLLPRERPLVSIIVPTRDRADFLARCADDVLKRPDYEPLELVIVDNDSVEAETRRVFTRLRQDSRVRIIQHPGRFNYSAINNHAVREARGHIVVLLNNDVDVISSGWLEEMVSHALRPEVGAVGAKLLYPDGRVQHAGVFLGVAGLAGHLHQLIGRADPGSFGRAILTATVSAVTGACLAVRKSVYEEVGGLDEVNLALAYNDVDLCLKIIERGYRNVSTPNAELCHWESASRGSDAAPENVERFRREADYLRRTWASKLDADPYYNANCSLAAVLPHQEAIAVAWLTVSLDQFSCTDPDRSAPSGALRHPLRGEANL